MSMKEKMHRGELYMPDDPEIVAEQVRCLDRLYEYNSTRPTEADKREKLLSEMFAQIGEGMLYRAAASRQFRRQTLPLGQTHLCQFQSDHGG